MSKKLRKISSALLALSLTITSSAAVFAAKDTEFVVQDTITRATAVQSISTAAFGLGTIAQGTWHQTRQARAFAAVQASYTSAELDSIISSAAAYIHRSTPKPQIASIGGEWAVLGLARSPYKLPDSYFEDYYNTVVQYLKENKGVLHTRKYSEYSRVILALTAAGYDARNVGGYDLTLPLADFEKTIWQGINGPIWALIALDSKNYPIPQNTEAAVQASRELYIKEILSRQLIDGGWSLGAKIEDTTNPNFTSDPDITGMALQALAKYAHKPEVAEAINNALDFLSQAQDSDGGFSSWNIANSESVVQVLVALAELGISVDDPRFVKNNNTVIDNILLYHNEDGSFRHSSGIAGTNQMSSEQSLYGLVAAQRALDGKNSLYNMADAKMRGGSEITEPKTPGLPGKHPDVKQMPVLEAERTFSDISSHPNKKAIEDLASRGIINGLPDGRFAPDNTMTRAEFAAIVVRGLGLEPKTADVFTDIPSTAWHAGYIGTAYSYGIVNGIGENQYGPNETISRQDAATMVARAAKICGMDTSMDEDAIRMMLAQFTDYITVGSWAKESLAFCYKNDILDQSDIEIKPWVDIKRYEVSQMLYNMLLVAGLM
jgi:hypothetical protein